MYADELRLLLFSYVDGRPALDQGRRLVQALIPGGQRIQEPKDVFSLPMEGQIVRDPLDGYIDQIRAAMVVIALAPTEPQDWRI